MVRARVQAVESLKILKKKKFFKIPKRILKKKKISKIPKKRKSLSLKKFLIDAGKVASTEIGSTR